MSQKRDLFRRMVIFQIQRPFCLKVSSNRTTFENHKNQGPLTVRRPSAVFPGNTSKAFRHIRFLFPFPTKKTSQTTKKHVEMPCISSKDEEIHLTFLRFEEGLRVWLQIPGLQSRWTIPRREKVHHPLSKMVVMKGCQIPKRYTSRGGWIDMTL